MAKHEFAILPWEPKGRYDEYDPWKYNFIKVDDELIEPLLPSFCGIKTFAHTLEEPWDGLNYCGITLIPPQSIPAFQISLLQSEHLGRLQELLALLKTAQSQNKFVIHYGI
ncbi:hypothetical protein [Youxingia wuxianensis]|uniref:Uncharacterized protein n=1 Tax=Youxingia wuxianensis TaxID=2763678 RepID=A0A926ICB8_9FIRM|nr:hypothetical protein [Youxingia wuxianensis]MBC8585027.1 hypothetical protein [Youxingia wuxianensis]